ncbi:MAG: bifunctional phosphopantothenoylcysteine decarboxylase/phosphopantothenate--cysteine ligase CoaBC, partial [Syntrophothermus sp.]
MGARGDATSIWGGKTVVVGVTGGIAAYKACELVSRLTKFGAEVHVIMTAAATNFIGVATLRELSRNPVVVDMFAEPARWHVQHIALAKAAQVFMIVPATANIIGKLACGIADDMLTTTVLATRAPLLLAPAMNTRMYENPIFQDNLRRLKEAGFSVVEPESGWLAEGEEGKGRLASTEAILAAGEALLARRQDFAGKTILVTAGATRERLDPFRFITNASTGKMGYAIAEAALARGAQVVLISGPSELAPPQGARVRKVESALEMYEAVLEEFPAVDA